jgi:hypothetical protein
MSDLRSLRDILYDILLSGEDSRDQINATQKMAVAMSNAIRKDGVNVIQLQNVVNQKVIQKVTEALRFLDRHTEESLLASQNVAEAEIVVDEQPEDTLLELIYSALDKKMSLIAFTRHMQERYVAEAVASMGRKEAKKILGIREPKLKQIIGGEENGNSP